MHKINLSVLVPVYGVEKYIERFARSLFNQSMTNNVEFVFIDDCSVDNSIPNLEKVINEYPQLKQQIRIERLPKNMGLLGARLAGLKMAKGEYIICNDSDDWVEPTMLEDMYKTAKSGNFDIVISDFFFNVGNDQKVSIQNPDTSDGKTCMYNTLLGKVHGSWWNKLFKRELITDSNFIEPALGMNMMEDIMVTAQLMFHAKKIGYINKGYYHYCRNSSSVSEALSEKSLKSIIYAYNLIERFYKEKNITEDRAIDALQKYRISTLSEIALKGNNYKLINFSDYKYLKPHILKHPYLGISYRLALWFKVNKLNLLLEMLIFARKTLRKKGA